MQRYTYEQFKAEHPDEAACLATVMEARHGGTELTCPGCSELSKFHQMGTRRAYACQRCGHHIYPCVGTPFEKSRTPLSKWLFAVWLFTTSRHGIAARELERQIGVSHKCAWRMAREIRKHMGKVDRANNGGMLGGHIEVDEAYIGGRSKHPNRGRSTKTKTPVFGLIERGGRVRAEPVPHTGGGLLTGIIEFNVEDGARISSDEYESYSTLGVMGYDHRTVRHSAKEFARKDGTHVNSAEGFFSRLKNSIRGTHSHVSRKYLSLYVDEFSYRYNMRKEPHAMFRNLIASLATASPAEPST